MTKDQDFSRLKSRFSLLSSPEPSFVSQEHTQFFVRTCSTKILVLTTTSLIF